MEEKPGAILQAEEVGDEVSVEETAVPAQDSWSKFPPQIDDISVAGDPKSSRGLIMIVVVLLLLAVGVVGFVVYKSNAMSKAQIAEVPIPTPDASITATPSAAPTPQITDKSVVKIQILNGSGVAGQAALVGAALEKADFKTPETANFDGDRQSDTIVNYTSAVDKSLVDEVVTILEETFTTVTASVSSTLTDFDIQIITGTDE